MKRTHSSVNRRSSDFQLNFFILICLNFILESCNEIQPTGSIDTVAINRNSIMGLSVDSESLKVNSGAGSVELVIETGGDAGLDWEISSEPEWLSFYSVSGSGPDTLVITHTPNTLGSSRKTEIMISSNAGDIIVPIMQTCQLHDDPEVNDVIVIGTLVEPGRSQMSFLQRRAPTKEAPHHLTAS